MPVAATRSEAPTAIRTDLGAIFVSLELSRSKWLITSLSPGGGEKMSKHTVRGWRRRRPADAVCSSSRRRRGRGPGEAFRSSSSRRRGSTASGSIACCRTKGSKATSSIRPRSRRRAGGGGPRPTRSTARRWFARCWPISAASRGCARWSGRRRPRKRTAAVSAASARR